MCAGIVEEPLMHDPSVFAEEIPQVMILPNDARGRGCVGGEGPVRGHSHFHSLVSRVRTSLVWLWLGGRDQVTVFVLDRGWISCSVEG